MTHSINFSVPIDVKTINTGNCSYSRKGNGRLDAVSNALQRHSDMHYSIVTYQEHALNVGSNSQACAYVGVQEPNGNVTWGSGIHEDIITASVLALISAVNRLDQ